MQNRAAKVCKRISQQGDDFADLFFFSQVFNFGFFVAVVPRNGLVRIRYTYYICFILSLSAAVKLVAL